MKFKVVKKISNTDIELRITFDKESEFEDAIDVLHRFESRYRLEELKKSSRSLWSTSGESRQLNSIVEDSVHRVAICLFDMLPECLRTSQIAQLLGLADSTVSNILNGTYGNAGYMFAKTGNCWNLSDEGLEETIDSILPTYLQNDSE